MSKQRFHIGIKNAINDNSLELRKLRIARNGFVVIHQAWGGAFGNASEIPAGTDVVDKYTAQVVDVYVQRTGKSKEEIEALIANGDYWMAGTEAIAMGFADELLPDNNNFLIAARIRRFK